MSGTTEAHIDVLCVEDDDLDAMILHHALRRGTPRTQVRRARDLSEALRQLRARRPDVLTLDLGLPDANRREALRRVRQLAPEVPLIVVTGGSISDEECRENAVSSTLSKHDLRDDLLRDAVALALQSPAPVSTVEQLIHRTLASATQRGQVAHLVVAQSRRPQRLGRPQQQVLAAHLADDPLGHARASESELLLASTSSTSSLVRSAETARMALTVRFGTEVDLRILPVCPGADEEELKHAVLRKDRGQLIVDPELGDRLGGRSSLRAIPRAITRVGVDEIMACSAYITGRLGDLRLPSDAPRLAMYPTVATWADLRRMRCAIEQLSTVCPTQLPVLAPSLLSPALAGRLAERLLSQPAPWTVELRIDQLLRPESELRRIGSTLAVHGMRPAISGTHGDHISARAVEQLRPVRVHVDATWIRAAERSGEVRHGLSRLEYLCRSVDAQLIADVDQREPSAAELLRLGFDGLRAAPHLD